MSFHLQLQPPPAYDPVKLLRPTELAAAQIGCRVRADSSHFIKADALVVADQAGSGDTGYVRCSLILTKSKNVRRSENLSVDGTWNMLTDDPVSLPGC
jgi:hypothetical protein